MLISTEIGSLREKLGDDKKIIQLIKNSGFTAYDFSMSSAQYAMEFLKDDGFYEYVKDIRAFADSIGIVCNQTHAPFPTIKPNRSFKICPLRQSLRREWQSLAGRVAVKPRLSIF